MGRGSGGGGGRGSAGGGRSGRAGGGVNQAPAQPGDETIPATYAELPNAGDMGRVVNEKGEVIVGSEGAPALPFNRLTRDESIEKLRVAGVPSAQIKYLEQQGKLENMAMILPDNAKLLGSPGYDAMGFAVGKDKVWRIQYKGNAEPLPAYDIGKYGVYADWKKKYGKIWVEQKERISVVANDMEYTAQAQGAHYLKANVSKARPNTQWKFSDLHEGNYGKDSKGRWRIFDPGAAVPQGAKVTIDF